MGDRARHQGVHGGVVGHGGVRRRPWSGRHGLARASRRSGGRGSMTTTIRDSRASAAARRRPAGQVHDRVEQGADRDAGVGQFAHDAVDQEGAVVLDDAQDVIAGGAPAPAVRGCDRDARGSPGVRRSAARPGVGQQRGQILDRQFRRLVRGIVFVGLGDEGCSQLARPAAAARRCGEGLLQRLRAGSPGRRCGGRRTWAGSRKARQGRQGLDRMLSLSGDAPRP